MVTGSTPEPRMTVANDGKVGIGTTTPSYPLEVSGATSGISIYASDNISATAFIDRTPFPDEGYDALADVKKIKSDGEGNIDHSTLPDLAYAAFDRPIYGHDNDSNITIIDYEHIEGRDLSSMVSIHTVALQQLLAKVDTLEQELCAHDNTYSWCK